MKGQVDIIFLLAMLFIVIVALFAVDSIWTAFGSNPTSRQLFNATPQGQLAYKNAGTSISILNNAVVILFLIGAVASAVAAAFADSSPVFIVPALVILPIEVFFSFILHDAFYSIIGASSFGTVAAQYPVIMQLFQYLPAATLVLSVIIIAVTFIK
jgi:hypothetical protein